MSGESGSRYCPRPGHSGHWCEGSPPLDRYLDGTGWSCPGILPDGSACDYQLRSFPGGTPRDPDEIRRAAVRAVFEVATDFGHDGLVAGDAEKFADAVLAVCMAPETA